MRESKKGGQLRAPTLITFILTPGKTGTHGHSVKRTLEATVHTHMYVTLTPHHCRAHSRTPLTHFSRDIYFFAVQLYAAVVCSRWAGSYLRLNKRIDTRNIYYKNFNKLQKCTRLWSLPHVSASLPRTSADLNTFSCVSPSLQVGKFDRHRPCCC